AERPRDPAGEDVRGADARGCTAGVGPAARAGGRLRDGAEPPRRRGLRPDRRRETAPRVDQPARKPRTTAGDTMTEITKLKELTPGVTTLLDPAVRSGTASPTVDDYVADFGREVDLRPMQTVVDEAMRRFSRADRASSDSWLGPRLHHA